MPHRVKQTGRRHSGATAGDEKEIDDGGVRQAVADTDRPATPILEGGIPLPEELTGRASGTGEDLTALFSNESGAHLADGFRGGSDDDDSSVHNQADGASGGSA
jgi:hypothetical protein